MSERDYIQEPRRVIDIAADMKGYSNPKPVSGKPPEVILAPVGVDYEPTEAEIEKWSETIAQDHDHSDYGDLS